MLIFFPLFTVAHVIVVDPGRDIEEYVHRIGRTGRAGERGQATTLVGERDRAFLPHLVRVLTKSSQPVRGCVSESCGFAA